MSFYATTSWHRSSLDTPIALYASHSPSDLRGKKPIIIMGGVHGDEPEGVRLAQDTLDWLTKQNPETVCPWILIPILKIDGYKAKTRGNGRGVDLNRNYPSVDWTGEYTKARYFPGPAAASESEIRGMVNLIQEMQPRLLIHCHSWNPCVVATGEKAMRDGERLARSSGYELMPEIGYPTPGSLSSYGWNDLKIPVICIEEQDHLQDLNTVWPRFKNGMQEIFRDKTKR
jgi:hypothetical protein